MLAHNLVRLEMERAAEEAGVRPTRISFVNTLAMHPHLTWTERVCLHRLQTQGAAGLSEDGGTEGHPV